MFILARYVIREHIGPFFFAFSIITSMLVLNFVLQAMRYIIGKGISMTIILEYIVYNLAWIVVLVVPMSILVATIMAFGRFASDNEVTAMKAGGIHFYRLIIPVALCAVVVTYLLVQFNDRVLPLANHKARVLKKNIQTKRPTLSIEPGVFLEGIDNFHLIIENKDELGSGIYGVTIFDKSNRDVTRSITAEKGTLEMDEVNEAMILTLENGEIHETNPKSLEMYQRVVFQRHRVIIPVENMTLKKDDETFYNEREKTISQLMEEVGRHRRERNQLIQRVIVFLEQDPSLAAGLDEKHRKAVQRLVFGGNLFDEISDHFVELNLQSQRWMDSSRTVLDPAVADLVDRIFRDSVLQDSLRKNRAFERSVTIPPVIRRADSLRPKSLEVHDTVRTAAVTVQQVGSGLNSASSYQRQMDQLMVEVNKKYSIPVACLVFVLIGAPIGVKARRGNLGIAGGISLFFFIAYYFCLVLGEDYADRQLLNPFFAMWFPNMALGAIGLFLTYQTASERSFGFSFVKNGLLLIVRVFRRRRG